MKRGDTEPVGILFCRQAGISPAALMDAYYQAEQKTIAQETAQIQQFEVPQALIDRCQAQIHQELLKKSRSECQFQSGAASKIAAGFAVTATILFGSIWNPVIAAQPLTLQYEFVAESDSIRLFFEGHARFFLSRPLRAESIRALLPAGYFLVPGKDAKSDDIACFCNASGSWIRYHAVPATGNIHISVTNLRSIEQTSIQGCPAIILERYKTDDPKSQFMTELYWIDRSANILYSLDSIALSPDALQTIAEQIILQSR